MKQKKKLIATFVSSVILVGLTVSLILLAVLQNRKQPQEVVETGFKPNVEWYDENGREFTITTADQLFELAQLSHYYDFAGQTIKLGADIVVNEGNATDWDKEAPKRSWYPIYDFAGTFDGQGHTISGIYAKVADTSLAMFADTKVGSVVQNFKLVNSYFYAWGSKGTSSIASNSNGTFKQIYSDAIVYCENGYAAGMFSKPQDGTVIEECWFAGSVYLKERFAGGIADIARGTKLTIEHCLNAGTIESPWEESAVSIGGICGVVMDMGGRLKINDCLNVGTITVSNTFRVGAIIGGGNDKVSVDVRNAYATKESYVLGIGNVIYNNTGGAIRIEENTLKGIGAYQWTTLDFDKYWAAIEGSTPVLKHFAEEPLSVAGAEKLFSFDWYDETATEYVLKTRDDLFGFTLMSHITNFRDKTVKLGADITVNKGNAADWMKKAPKLEWMPIQMFAGTFDGQRHTISGIYLHGDVAIGLFEKTNKYCTLKNFYLKNSYFHGTGGEDGYSFVGSIVGRGGGVIDTVYSNAIVSTTSLGAGGFIGQMNINEDYNRITNCWFDGTVNMIGEEAIAGGGMVGSVVQGKLTVEHCLNTGHINSSVKNRGAKVGGFVANLEFNKAQLAIKDCLSVGVIKTNNQFYVGSIIGVACAATSATVDQSFASTEAYLNPSGRHVSVNTSGTGIITGGGINIDHDKLIGLGGYQWTELHFDKYWVVQTEGTPMLKSFAKGKAPSLAGVQKLFDTSWYDKKADVYTLDSKEDLYGFAMLSGTTDFEGKTIKLVANIAINTGNAFEWSKNAPASKWSPIKKFAGTFDGQGHTISGVYVNSTASVAGLFETVTGKVQNLRLENSYFHSTEDILGSVAGRGQGATFKNIYSDAILESEKGVVGGIVGQLNTENQCRVEECWFAGSASANASGVGGVVGGIIYADTLIKNCLNTGTIITTEEKNPFAGGLCGYINMGGHLAITDSMDVGNFETETEAYVGSLVGYIGGAPTYEFMNAYASKHSVGRAGGNTKQKGAIQMDLEAMKGVSAYMLTDLDFADVWVARTGEAPALKNFVVAEEVIDLTNVKPADTKWSEKKTLEISTREELYGFAKLSLKGNTFEGKKITVKKDITINSGDISTWQYVWNPVKDFAGTFDGGEYTISGIYVKSNSENAGMFETLTGTVQNLAIADSSIYTTENNVGSIAGRIKGATLKNIYSTADVTTEKGLVGGLVGRIGGTKSEPTEDVMEECWFGGTVNAKTTGAGGLAGGIIYSDVKVTDSLNTGIVNSEATENPFVGGLCGYINMGGNLAITDSLNTGILQVKDGVQYVGSVVGFIGGNPVTYSMTNVYAETTIYDSLVGNGKQNGAVAVKGSDLYGLGAYMITELTFYNSKTDSGVWAAYKNATPVLKNYATGDLFEARVSTEWYTNGSKTIMDEADLYGLAKLSQKNKFTGETIKIGDTITVNEGLTGDDRISWEPIGQKVPFEGTFDGDGNTISGIYMNTDEAVSGLFGEVRGTVRNFTLSSSEFKSSATYFGTVVGYGRGNMDTIYVDDTVTITSSAAECGGLVGRYGSTSTATISNCWFAGNITSSAQYCGGIVGRVENGQKSIVNCMSSGTINNTVSVDQVAFAGGMVGGVYSDNGKLTTTFTMSNCLNTAEVNTTSPYGVGSVIGRARNIKAVTIEHTYTTNESSSSVGYVTSTSGYVGIGNASAVNNGTTDASGSPNNAYAVTGTPILKTNANLNGAEGYKNTQLDFWVKEGDTGLWVARKDKTPALKSFVDPDEWNKGVELNVQSVHTDWYYNNPNEDKKTYTIGTAAELYGLAEIVNNDNHTFSADETVYLTDDIDVNSGDFNKNTWMKWNPITSFAGTFDGKYDGKVHTISGIYIDETSSTEVGLFRIVTGSVQNFGLKNSYVFSTKNNTGSIVGELRGGRLLNVYSDAKVTGSGQVTGGIIGRVKTATSTLTGCWFDGEVQASNLAAGGIAGGAIQHVTFKDCLNTGSVANTISANAWTGGICGYNNNGAVVTVENCINVGSVTASNSNGAVLGQSNVTNGFVVTNVYVSSQSCATAYSGKAPQGTINTFDENDYKGLGGMQFITFNFDTPTNDKPIQWVLRAGDVPGLADWTKKNEKLVVDTNWYKTDDATLGTEGNPYQIRTKEELYGFAKLSLEGNTFAGKTIQLTSDADIAVNDVDDNTDVATWKNNAPAYVWTPIKDFAGTFDGNEKTIEGVYVNTSRDNAGLFGVLKGTVKNLGLTTSAIYSSGSHVGSIAGCGEGATLFNVYSNARVEGTATDKYEFGGIVGFLGELDGSLLEQCWFDGIVVAKGQRTGGLIGGTNEVMSTVKNSLNTGSINSSGAHVGGLCGRVNFDTRQNGKTTTGLTIINSMAVGDITTSNPNRIGSLLGTAYGTITFEGVAYTSNHHKSTAISFHNSDTVLVGEQLIVNQHKDTYKGDSLLHNGFSFDNPNTSEIDGIWKIRTNDVPGLANWLK